MTISNSTGLSIALRRAKRAIGRTGSNPAVGCFLVDKSSVAIALACTADSGRPHAEVLALEQAGELARGSTAFVTLEPCAHFGETGPCCDSLIQAGVSKVVVGTSDMNPLVKGAGITRMRAAGIEVLELNDEACTNHHLGFNRRVSGGSARVTMKIATSLDGGMTKRNTYTRTYITGKESQRQVHLLRAQCDVLITGRGTMELDQPQLNVRLNGYDGPNPKVIVWKRKQEMADLDANSVLIEAGPTLSSALFDQIDELHWYRNSEVFGDNAVRPAFLRNNALDFASDHPTFKLQSQRNFGSDVREVWLRG